MKQINPSLVALLPALFLTGIGMGQEANKGEATPAQIRVAGVVLTVRGLPVPGAPMQLLHLSTGQAWTITTDENGKFAAGLPAGRYRLEARHLGLGSVSEEVELTHNTDGLELRLRRASAGTAETLPLPKSEPAKPASPAKPTSPDAPAKAAIDPSLSQPKVSAKDQAKVTESGSANGKQSRQLVGKPSSGKGKRAAGFAEVEPKGLPSATSELGKPESTDSAFNQPPSGDAFLIAGTVGQTGLVKKADEEDDSTGQVGSSEKKKSKTSKKLKAAKSEFGQVNPVEGVDLAVTEKQMSRLTANRVRVTLSEKYGNSLWDAKPYSLTDPNPAKIPYSRERFRGKIGGPLDIPHLFNGRNRTFFYVDYELDRNTVPLDDFVTVPLPQERIGDFTGRGVPLFDPLSNLTGERTPLCGQVCGTVPASRIDPIALNLMKYFPLPNLPGTAQNYHLQTNLPQNADRLNTHILHTISPRFSFQATYNLNSMRGELPYLLPSLQNSMTAREQNVTLALVQSWTPRFVNETRINWTRSQTVNEGQFTFKQDVAKQLGVTGGSSDPFFYGVPAVLLSNFNNIEDVVPENRVNQTFRVADNFSYSFPKQTLRGGGEIRRMQNNFTFTPVARGEFNFSGLMTSQLDATGNPIENTGFDLADFLLGLPDQSAVNPDTHMAYMRSWWTIGYFQDDWRIHPRLSVNVGARYEVRTPGVEKYDRLANLDLNPSITAAARVLPGETGPFSGQLPRSLIRTRYNAVEPRVGIAWRPFARNSMVVRAGYGMFYNAAVYNQLDLSLSGQPPFTQEQSRQTSADNLLSLANGFPPAAPGTIQNTIAVNPNYKVPYVQIWNLTTELPIRPNLTVELTYTGTKGTDLSLYRSPNRPTPGDPLTIESRRPIAGLPAFRYEDFGANSIYHALQLRVQRRMSHGLEILGLYTFGKSIDNASYVGGGRKIVVQDDKNFAAERALSQFDIRHQFTFVSTYDLPFSKQQWLPRNGLLSKVLGNWEISQDTTIATGMPLTPIVGGAAASASGTGASFSLRPDLVGNPTLPAGLQSPEQFFNTSAFALPPPDRYGTSGRSVIDGPGLFNMNLKLRRKWRFGQDEQYHLTLAWEVDNLTNTPNFAGVTTLFGTSTFGRVKADSPMRTMNLSARMSF